MRQKVTPKQILERFKLVDRSFTRLDLAPPKATMWLDLFHADDPSRSDESKIYPLSLTFPTADLNLIEGDLDRLRREFSGEILRAAVADEQLEVLCDCRFFDGGEPAVVHFTIGGDSIEANELPSAAAG